MPKVVHFSLMAKDPERAIKFYSKVFGWKFEKWNDPSIMEYWMITTGNKREPGINGGMSVNKKLKPAKDKNTANFDSTIAVSDIDKYAKLVKEAGGKILMKKTAIPRVGWMATVQDTEGNMVGMMQNDKKAK